MRVLLSGIGGIEGSDLDSPSQFRINPCYGGKWIFILVCIVCVLKFAAPVAAQNAVIEIGVRGGVFFSEPPIEVPTNQYFSPSYTVEKFPLSAGPAVGLLLFRRVEVRFEAVYKHIEFQSKSSAVLPPSNSSTSNVVGHSWEYPLLGMYRFSHGPAQPFAGGGVSLGGSTSGTEEFQTQTPSGPVTINGTFQKSNPTAYYISGGVDFRTALLSVRPELRYARWSDYSNTQTQTLNSRNSCEFVVGVSIHPFQFK